MAATIDNRPTSSLASNLHTGILQWREVDVDFTVAANQLANAETMSLLDIAAGEVVLAAFIDVDTADADITDVDLGLSSDGTTDDTLVDGADISSTGIKSGGTNAVAPNYTAAGAAMQLVLTNNDAQTIDAAVIKVSVLTAPAA